MCECVHVCVNGCYIKLYFQKVVESTEKRKIRMTKSEIGSERESIKWQDELQRGVTKVSHYWSNNIVAAVLMQFLSNNRWEDHNRLLLFHLKLTSAAWNVSWCYPPGNELLLCLAGVFHFLSTARSKEILFTELMHRECINAKMTLKGKYSLLIYTQMMEKINK